MNALELNQQNFDRLKQKYKKLQDEVQNYSIYVSNLQKQRKRETNEMQLEILQNKYQIKILKEETMNQKEIIVKQTAEILNLKTSLSALCGEEINLEQ